MSDNFKKNIKANVISSYVNFATNALFTFFLSPILIGFLGTSNFGIWKGVQKILDFASLADGRASQALKWVVANKKNQSDNKEKQQAVGSAIKIWFYFLPILLLILLGLIWILPYMINDLDNENYNVVRIVGLIMGVNILLNPLLGIPDAILVGVNQAYKSNFVQTIWIVISNISMVAVASLGYGIIGLATVVLIIGVLKGICVLLTCKKSVTWLRVRQPERQQLKTFFGFSAWVLLWSFVSRLLLSSEVILIGFLIGSDEVSNYTFTAYIFALALSISLMTTSAAMPGLGAVFGAKDYVKSAKIANSIRDINIFISVFFGCIMLICNKSFVTLWMGSEFYLGDDINALITIVLVQLILIRNEAQMQDVGLKIRSKVLTGLVGAVLSIVFSIILFYFIRSIIAIFVGIIIGRLIMSFRFPLLVNKMFTIKYNYKRLLFAIMILFISYFYSISVSFNFNWGGFVLYAIGIFLVVFLTCFLLLLPKESRRELLRKKNNNDKI